MRSQVTGVPSHAGWDTAAGHQERNQVPRQSGAGGCKTPEARVESGAEESVAEPGPQGTRSKTPFSSEGMCWPENT